MNRLKLNLKDQNTNWKYLLIVVILFFIVGGGILCYGRIIQEKIKTPEIKIPKKENVSDYTTPEVKKIAPIPVEKKITNELANIFREEINKDLMQDLKYRDDILALKEREPISVDCDRSESIDLNSDGIEEFIIFPYQSCKEGVYFWGASGAGPIYIFQKINKEWKIIGKLGGSMMNIEARKTSGYYDITTFWPLGAGSAEVTYYIWDGKQYIEEKTEEVEIGI